MSIYRISTFIAYDHLQGAFMFYNEATAGIRMVAAQYITGVEPEEKAVRIICTTKHLKDNFLVKSKDPESDVEKITVILEEF